MRPTLWIEAKQVFAEAIDVPLQRRTEFLRDRCADARLRDEVLRLLRGRERIDAGAGASVAGAPVAGTPPPERARSSSDGGAVHRPPAIAPGLVVGGRYELGERMGVGAFGAVHRATDRRTGEEVAVKVLSARGLANGTALRREVAMLRRTRLRGVVEMLDEGAEHGRAWVVMRLATGRPFPGTGSAGPVPWEVLAPRAFALVEAVGRLHWLGVLHRDLKPDNVLVAADGAVTIVDLGVAQHAPDPDTSDGCLVGTPAYLAPERLVCGPATPSTDLYAVGVMLYEALAARPPRAPGTLAEFIARRLEPVTPLGEVAPGVPRHVAATVDALLRANPSRRPRSARVVATLLRGGTEVDARPRLPWIGGDAVPRAVTGAVLAGRAIDVEGPRGSGRSRALEEAERRLAARGVAVLRATPASEALGSLVPGVVAEPVVRAPSDAGRGAPPAPETERVRRVRRAVRAILRSGTAVFADDWEDLDAVSRDVLRGVRRCGPLVRVLAQGGVAPVAPAALAETDLRALFRGPDRVFHLREDGARELYRRTAGRPGDVIRELETWIEGGVARVEDGEVVLERSGLDRLASNLLVALPRRELPPGTLPERAVGAAGVLAVAGFPLSAADLARVLDADPADVAADAAALVREGVARTVASGAFAGAADVGGAAGWAPERSREIHSRLAELPSAPPDLRVHHLIAADRPREALRVAHAQAMEHLRSGGRTMAAALLHEAIRALHAPEVPDAADVDAVAGLVVDVALGGGTPDDLRTACWELGRIETGTPALAVLEDIARAALLTLEGQAPRALERLEALGVAVDPENERRRNSVRSFAARVAGDPSARRSVLRDVAVWARRVGGRTAHSTFTEGLAWERYAEERFAVAARLHQRSARRHQQGNARLSAWINAASAALEAGDLGEAERLAREAEEFAARHRLALHEARALVLRRAVAYRRGEPLEPDVSLVDDLTGRIPPSIAGVAFLTEAAFAWRAGRGAVARDVAARAAAQASSGGNRAASVLAEALHCFLCGPGRTAPLPEVPPVPQIPVGIRLQCLALIAPGGGVRLSTADREPLARLAGADLPRAEVLSDREILERLAG